MIFIVSPHVPRVGNRGQVNRHQDSGISYKGVDGGSEQKLLGDLSRFIFSDHGTSKNSCRVPANCRLTVGHGSNYRKALAVTLWFKIMLNSVPGLISASSPFFINPRAAPINPPVATPAAPFIRPPTTIPRPTKLALRFFEELPFTSPSRSEEHTSELQ